MLVELLYHSGALFGIELFNQRNDFVAVAHVLDVVGSSLGHF